MDRHGHGERALRAGEDLLRLPRLNPDPSRAVLTDGHQDTSFAHGVLPSGSPRLPGLLNHEDMPVARMAQVSVRAIFSRPPGVVMWIGHGSERQSATSSAAVQTNGRRPGWITHQVLPRLPVPS